MTTAQHIASNPFALMMNPDAVFAAMAGSDRLNRLHSRICRPLDKQTGTTTAEAVNDAPIEDFGDAGVESFGAEN